MQKKGLGFLLLAGLLIISALVFLPSVRDLAQAQTGFSVNGYILGWLWSDNIGWIRMGTSDTNAVKIVNNNLQGHAWSDSVGWINLNPTLVPPTTYPSAPSHGVQIESTPISGNNHAVTGWARACSVFVSGCSGDMASNTARGDWDGWIKMSNSKYDTASHIFSGSAWGDLNVGWASFHAGDPTIDCRNIPLPPGCIPNCTPNFNCTCNDPQPPSGCPPRCLPPGSCDGPIRRCIASPANVLKGAPVTYRVSPVSASYTYVWSGDTGTVATPIPSNTNPLVTTYNATGTKAVSVVVNDGGTPVGTYPCKTEATNDDVFVGCVSPLRECPDGICVENLASCVAPCTFDLTGVSINLRFQQNNNPLVETSQEVVRVIPESGCTTANPLNLRITANTPSSFPAGVGMVCSKVTTNPVSTDWSLANCSGITSTTLIGVQAPSNFKRSTLVNGNQLQVIITNLADEDNYFGRWIYFIGGTGT